MTPVTDPSPHAPASSPQPLPGTDARRFLIIRPSAIGDVVMALPMAAVIKKACPGASVIWLAEPYVADFLRAQPTVDEVLVWPKSRWKELLKARHLTALVRDVSAFRRRLKSQPIDVAVDVQGLLRSRLLAVLSGARRRVGFASKEPGRFLMTEVISKGPRTRTIGTEYEYMVRYLGFWDDGFPMGVSVPHEAFERAQGLLTETLGSRAYAVFAPFTTRPQKHWIDHRWANLAQRIAEEQNLPVVLLGGGGDAKAAEQLATLSPRMVSLAGRTTLLESAAVLQGAQLVIGVDTGLTHMAVALKRPTVTLFGATCPYLHTRSNRALVLYKPLPCSPCRRRPTCKGAFPCMAALREDDVMNAARRVLAASAEG